MSQNEKPYIKRMWINQPSALQPWHKYHGQNVLMHHEKPGATTTVYFTSGLVVSMIIHVNALSEGWK